MKVTYTPLNHSPLDGDPLLIPSQDLGSELARASLGIVPASSIPEIVLSQFSLINWDHQKVPGFVWRLSSLTWQDHNEGRVTSIDGFKIAGYETVAVLRKGEIVALVPEGSWVMKPEAELAVEEFVDSQLELVWVDLRPITFNFDINDLLIQGTYQRLEGKLSIRVVDPAKLINELILKHSKTWDFQDEVLGRLSTLMRDEASSFESHNPSWQSLIAESSSKKLGEHLSSWGLLLTSFRIADQANVSISVQSKVEETDRGKSAQIQKESDAKPSIRVPQVSTTAPSGAKKPMISENIIQILEWDTTPKRWIPASLKGELKCDGCGDHADVFAMCGLSCRFLHKCKLCRKCYLLRRSCAFFVMLKTLKPRKKTVDELQELAEIDVGKKLDARS